MRILVVCGAGASSTFVAGRLRRAAHSRGLAWETRAGSADAVSSGTADLVLIGPHLATEEAALRRRAQAPTLVLPDDIFTDREGVRTLDLCRAVLGDPPSKGTP